ncbi:C6 zinc finger domain-containing protein [Bipolaris maydis]|nr:C6 zinc finger domain-containing protein [Bipolaris maydis]
MYSNPSPNMMHLRQMHCLTPISSIPRYSYLSARLVLASFRDYSDSSLNSTNTNSVGGDSQKSGDKASEAPKAKRKTQAELDAELMEKLQGLDSEGGAAGVEYEDGKPASMKRSANSSADEVNKDAPSLVDVFKLRMNDLELPEDPTPTQSYIPVNGLSPTGSAGPTSPKPKIQLTSESAFLLQTYVRTVATWMDIFDHASTYQHKVPQLALGSPLLFHCICAFTANHLALSNSSHDPSWGVCAVRHYGEALRLLIEALSMPEHEHALTASMLLLSYEIHGALRSEDYRRHYLGLVSLVKSRRVTAQSTGIDLANFWIYVRHEIVVAMASEQPLVFNPAEWEVSWVEGETREDVLGNHVLWILARVINLVFGPDGNTEAGKIQRQDFLHEMEIWRRGLSETFIGIPHGETDEDGFCKVYFPVAAAAAAAFWYHIAHILLYAEPELQDEAYIPLIQEQAIKVTDIAISEFPPSLMVFSTHGLFYAAKHIQGISRKARIWNVLNEVETQTGYDTRTTVKLLQSLVEQDAGR